MARDARRSCADDNAVIVSIVIFQTCMFSEFVDDFGLDTKVWPRAAALAERLWANPSTDALAAEHRYYSSNC